jgi:hypothetical protein
MRINLDQINVRCLLSIHRKGKNYVATEVIE